MAYSAAFRHRVEVWRSWTWQERRLFVEAWLLLLLIDLALRVVPFGQVRTYVARQLDTRRAGKAGDEVLAIEHLRQLVDVASRHHLYVMRCLRRALTLQWLLGREGIATTLEIGVRKEAQDLRAHAWLEHNGRLVGERGENTDGFARLTSCDYRR